MNTALTTCPSSSPDTPSPASPDVPSTGEALPKRLVAELIRLVNDDVMTLDTGNALLAALRLPTLPDGRRVDFRVPVATPALGERPSEIFRDAQAQIAAQVGAWRHTCLDGLHEGYGIEDMHERIDGLPLYRVHADLFLTVTVAAHPPGNALCTAKELLTADLAGVDDFTVRADRIEFCDEDEDQDEGEDLDNDEDVWCPLD
ncbi:hypothetical protein OWR29_26175 [Actinoplanes sp. Pm04-4]|uniref:Uncharacterized protein n=1 Tax=Paractinoplanes pyxinae TaxID=2997416 RepID=A0ABT4B4S7_9ACTN|nr:hypothetical protein [Actinoplanes pyxinae]MCY1141499.1 hypothetical protein [Actinoplanes pyxinae]